MSLTLDGSVAAHGSSGTVTTPTLTTTAGSGEIVVAIGTNATSVTSVTAAGLTFTLRSSISGTSGFTFMAEYVAPYTTNFSGTITVVVASALIASVVAF